MTEKLKKRCIIYSVGVLVYVSAIEATIHLTLTDRVKFIWFLIAYLIIGFDAFKKLEQNLLQKKFLSEYTLIILATIGALGIGRYVEGVLVILLFELGMIFEAFSRDRAKKNIEELIKRCDEHF